MRRCETRKAAWILVALAALLAGPPARPAPVYGQARTPRDTLVVAQGFDPRCLSPLFGTAQQDINISGQMVEVLIRSSHDQLGFIPELAIRWQKTAPDTIRVHLRRNVRFTNGEPFDAESAKWSLEQAIRSPSYRTFTSMLRGVDVVDSATVDVRAHGPTSERMFLTAISKGGFMYPRAYTQQVGMLQGFCQRPVGTGPYKLAEWIKDDRVVFDANPDYWGGVPKIRRLVFRPIPEGAARVAALQAGDIDLSIEIPLDAWERVQKDANLATQSLRGMRVFRLTLSSKWDGPLKDKRVRQAMAHAVDVDAIIRGLFGGRARKLNAQGLTPEYFGYQPHIPAIAYDPNRAKQLLAEAGLANGFQISFKFPVGRFAQDKETAEALSAQLARVGIRARMTPLEPGEYLTQLSRLELRDMFFGGFLTAPDAHFHYLQYLCDFRYAYWCRPEFDQLLGRAQTSPSDEDRNRIYRQIADLQFDDPPAVNLFAPYDLYATRRNVAGWRPTKSQWLPLAKAVKLD